MNTTSSASVIWVSTSPMFSFIEFGDTETDAAYGKGDRLIVGMPWVENGVYRRVDQSLVTWLSWRVDCSATNPDISLADRQRSREFVDHIVSISGIHPLPYTTLPVGYRKPSAEPGRDTCTSREVALWGR